MAVDIDFIIEVLRNALDNINNSYFKVPVNYSELGIVRERVFCYELYHQIRRLLPEEFPLAIHGEIDKRGHPDFTRLENELNPDFVFHVTTTHDNNTLVIEVKGSLENYEGVKKDFETLFRFTSQQRYLAGIFILYNHNVDELTRKTKNSVSRKNGKNGKKIMEIATSGQSDNIYIICIKKAFHSCSVEERQQNYEIITLSQFKELVDT